jgi:hypothetical protein
MIAIGEPREALPTIGAAKAYFSDHEWQDAVLAWMEKARLIGLAVGPTPAVSWELRRAIELDHLQKLILILPPSRPHAMWKFWRLGAARADREARVRLLLDGFAGTPWVASLEGVDWSRLIVAHVNAENRLVCILARRPVDVDYQIALVLAFYGILCVSNGSRA